MASLDVDTGSVQDVFVRHIPHGGDPIFEPPEPADGRWQHGATVAAWYLADEADTAWAEWYRALAGTGLPPAQALPRDLWRWRIDLARVALLDDDRRLERVGISPPLPMLEQWPACQEVGDASMTRAMTRCSLPRLPVLGIATLSSSVPNTRSPAARLNRRRQ